MRTQCLFEYSQIIKGSYTQRIEKNRENDVLGMVVY